MLRGAEGHRWQPHLTPLPTLFSRLHDTLMRVHRASAAASRRPHSPAPAGGRPGRTTRRPGATPASIAEWLRKLPARHRALLLLPDIRATYYVRDPDTHTAAAADEATALAGSGRPVKDGAVSRIERMLSFYHTPEPTAAATPAPAVPDAHDVANSHTSPTSLPHSTAYSAPSPAELQNTREMLTSLLAALATLDFSAFLHSFNMRVAVGAAPDPSTPFHTAVLNAALTLLRTHRGCETMLRHVTVAAESLLRLLDPANIQRRAQTLNVRPPPVHVDKSLPHTSSGVPTVLWRSPMSPLHAMCCSSGRNSPCAPPKATVRSCRIEPSRRPYRH